MIKKIDFETILPIWVNHLWNERKSPIESNSAMCFLNGYDLENMRSQPSFFAYYINENIVGVNSGHRCRDNSYRSRGLYVFNEYRGKGIAVELLLATIEEGKKENTSYVWSFPRLESWRAYEKAGFTLSSEWLDSELGKNAYCRINL